MAVGVKLSHENPEFYDSRTSLAKRHSIEDQFRAAEELWAYWNTGTQAYTEGIAKLGKLKRLILPAPDSEGLRAMADAVRKPVDEIVSDPGWRRPHLSEAAIAKGGRTLSVVLKRRWLASLGLEHAARFPAPRSTDR